MFTKKNFKIMSYQQINALADKLQLVTTKVATNNWIITDAQGTVCKEGLKYSELLPTLKKYESGELFQKAQEVELEPEPLAQEDQAIEANVVQEAQEVEEVVAEPQPLQPLKVTTAKVKYVEVYERYSPENKSLLGSSTSTLKTEVLESLSLQNAAQAAKWAKKEGMEGIDLCYKAHWAALVEKVRQHVAALSEEFEQQSEQAA